MTTQTNRNIVRPYLEFARAVLRRDFLDLNENTLAKARPMLAMR